MARDSEPREGEGITAASSAPEQRTEQRCAECGYGVVSAGSPPRCPLCGSTTWTTTARPMWAGRELLI